MCGMIKAQSGNNVNLNKKKTHQRKNVHVAPWKYVMKLEQTIRADASGVKGERSGIFQIITLW